MTIAVAHIVAQTIVALAIVACVTALGLHGTLDAAAVTGILGAVVGVAGGTAAARVGAEYGNGHVPAEPPVDRGRD